MSSNALARIRTQRALTWCAPLVIGLWLGAFVLLCRFVPPPHPSSSAIEISNKLGDHTTAIQLGLLITMFASALIVPFSVVIWNQMRRMEGGFGPLAMTQALSGAALSIEFIVPLMVWQTALYRLDAHGPQIVRMLNDMAWLMFVVVVSTAIVQLLSIAAAILIHDRDQAVFPRWVGWLNLWVAVSILPAGIVLFFHTGPFSWVGLIGFYVPLTIYAAWWLVMFVCVRRAIDQEAAVLNTDAANLAVNVNKEQLV